MCDPINQPPSNITCNRRHPSYLKRSQRKHIRKVWRGSHQGYSGDIEALPTSYSEDEGLTTDRCVTSSSTYPSSAAASTTSASTPSDGSVRIQFYRDLPKRRSHKVKSNNCVDNNTSSNSSKEQIIESSDSPTSNNSEIDLSQVRLVSCREYDLRLYKKERQILKTVLKDHGLDPSDPSQSECDSTDTEEKKIGYNVVSGPLATVDHGPVFEFNKESSNLLTEIYNIGACNSKIVHGRKRCTSPLNHLMDEKRCKRETILEKKAVPLKCLEHTSLTMDEAVSFSPFARVIFDAQSPHTIVHINAAYGSLVNQGVVSPSSVGQPLGDDDIDVLNNSNISSNNSKSIPTIVANYLQKIAPSSPPYQIFPVVSRISDYHIFEAYRKLQCLKSPVMSGTPPHVSFDSESGSKMIGNGSSEERSIHFVSYYMLQIESNSQIQQSSLCGS